MTIQKPTQFTLLDGTTIPWLAWGNGTAVEGNSQDAVEKGSFALGCGIRHIDTAQLYKNEKQTGEAITSAGVERGEVYVTSKLSGQEGANGWEAVPLEKIGQLVQDSISRLGFVPDLYLIHNPYVVKAGDLKALWKIFEGLKEEGVLKSIGVSNFRPQDLEEILDGAKYKPVVNQIEYHPYLLTHLEPLLKLQAQHGILTASYGGLTPVLRHPSGGGPLVPVLERIASRLSSSLGKNIDSATVLLLWMREQGVVAVTASKTEERIRKLGEVANLPEGLLEKGEVEEIERVGKGVHFRFYREHMEKDFAVPDLPAA
ncbi:conjugated polyketone reductase C1 [Panaeolus papilionaceus]|nr:conjugated polyketone reductase C1 [Panaeolus papilionaceus]